ncbi:hypothetical protein [Peterkaempfera sp. SMS 1(5)a]|uniref:hypothetical protein n=1 Tax=Peterkaempfera podocarpi TaxID=3232308 RepID=UPI00366C7D37
MEHQVLVPLPARLVRRALCEPGLPARCVPGLTVDRPAEADGPAAGRLRLRAGGVTITYRGEFTVTPEHGAGGGAVSVVADGQESRGTGGVSAILRIAVREEPSDTAMLVVTGEVVAKGRLAELDEPAAAAAGRRLLERFAVALTAAAEDAAQTADAEAFPAAGPEDAADFADFADSADELEEFEEFEEELRDAEAEALDAFPELGSPDSPDDIDTPGDAEPDRAETVDADLNALEAARMLDGEPAEGAPGDTSDLLDGPVRRSIVGRSAEEVDHAPPRGRYAPALPARSARARAAARWTGGERGPATPVATPEVDRAVLPWVIGGGVALLGGAVALARALRRH